MLAGVLQQPGKLLKASLVITAGVAGIELAGGYFSNSISLVSDAVHVFTDVMAIALSLFALTLSARSHSGIMTYGYHRAEVLAALGNGITLSALSAWIILEAFQRVMMPRQVDAPIMLAAASIGLAGNVAVMLLLRQHATKSINIQSAFAHVIYDMVSSVTVIITGLVAYYSGLTIVDPLAAFLIAGLIARSAYTIVRGSTHILLEGAPRALNVQEIATTLKQLDGVVDVHDLHVWTISTGLDAVSGHVVVRDQMLSQSRMILDEITRVLQERYKISHATIQLEHEREVSFRTGSRQ
ncbi:MAG: cation diffusion facilitator family transporter [Nitrososphaera sp.]